MIEDIDKIISLGLIETLINLLDLYDEPEIIETCLETFNNIFAMAKGYLECKRTGGNAYIQRFLEYGGMKTIDKLFKSSDNNIFAAVNSLYEKHLSNSDGGAHSLM